MAYDESKFSEFNRLRSVGATNGTQGAPHGSGKTVPRRQCYRCGLHYDPLSGCPCGAPQRVVHIETAKGVALCNSRHPGLFAPRDGAYANCYRCLARQKKVAPGAARTGTETEKEPACSKEVEDRSNRLIAELDAVYR